MNATDLLWVHTNGGTVTIKPNSKSPNVKLFYVGSSGVSPLIGDQRKRPVTSLVIEFTVPKDRFPERDLIVIETLLGDNRALHLLELTWNRDGSSHIDLKRVWINVPGRMIQGFSSRDGSTGLTVVVNGKVYSTHTDESSSGKIDADTICQYASGRISDSEFLERAGKVVAPASAEVRNVAAEQLADFLLQAISIASEPLSFNPFKKGRIKRIRELWKIMTDLNQGVQAFRKFLR